jgi:hypothetical protein
LLLCIYGPYDQPEAIKIVRRAAYQPSGNGISGKPCRCRSLLQRKGHSAKLRLHSWMPHRFSANQEVTCLPVLSASLNCHAEPTLDQICQGEERGRLRRKRLVQSEPLVFRMHKSEFSAAIVARPSGWLISTFRMAICRDTPNSTRQRETMSNVVLPGGAVYVPQGEAHKKRPTAQCPSISAVTCRPTE